MARINIEDQFWTEISAVAAKIGNQDLAIGSALRLFKLAQERTKQGRSISKEDWEMNEFPDALIPIFAQKKSDGSYEVRGAKKHFGWLQKCVESGKFGGKKSRRRAHEQNQPLSQRVSKGFQPSSSFSSSSSRKKTKTSMSSGQQDLPDLDSSPKASSTKVDPPPSLLVKIWNEHRGGLPECMVENPKRQKNAKLRWKENPDEKCWVELVKFLARSDWHTGKNPTGWLARIDFFLKPDTWVKFCEGSLAGQSETRAEKVWSFGAEV